MTTSDEELVAEARAWLSGAYGGAIQADLITRLADRLSTLSRPGLDREEVRLRVGNAAIGFRDAVATLDKVKAIDDATDTILAALTTGGERISGGEKMMLLQELHLNDFVFVRLSYLGRKILREDHERLRRRVPQVGDFKLPKEDDAGYSRFQLWDLMQIFGPHISLGRTPPFDSAIRLEQPIAKDGERTSGGEISSSLDHDPAAGVALERLTAFLSRLNVAAGHPKDDDPAGNDADLGQRIIKLRHDLRMVLSSAKPADRERSRDDIAVHHGTTCPICCSSYPEPHKGWCQFNGWGWGTPITETSGRQEQPAASSGLSDSGREGGARAEDVAPADPAFDAWVRHQMKAYTAATDDAAIDDFIYREFTRMERT